MKLMVGLGNPGSEYKDTRHNVGFMVVDWLSTKSEIRNSKQILLVKPDTFMNRSGEAVKKIMTNYKLQMPNLYIIHDDLDIPLGKYKIQLGKGPKDHRGVLSVEMALGSKEFWRVRIGVENRDPGNRISGEEYTLQEFTDEEKKIVDRVMDEAIGRLCTKLEIY